MNALILLCAGSGRRMEGTVSDKILAPVKGLPVFRYSLDAFLRCSWVQSVVFVHRDPEQRRAIADAIAATVAPPISIHWVEGGAQRQDSVFNGLEAIGLGGEIVAIHDAARPLIRTEVIDKAYAAACRDGAAVTAHPVTDTIKRLRAGKLTLRKCRLRDLERKRLWAMETPQIFRYDWIFDAYQRVRANGISITDDAAALELLGKPVTLVENSDPNPKITRPSDFAIVETLLNLRT